MKFFCDNCLSPRVAKAIHHLVQPKHTVVHLREKFDPAITDVEWITQLGNEEDWIIVSADLNIRKRPAEREVLNAAKLTTFFFAKGYTKFDTWQQAKWSVEKWPLIIDMAAKVTPGSAFLVPNKGNKLQPL
jgi:hypothetical protein